MRPQAAFTLLLLSSMLTTLFIWKHSSNDRQHSEILSSSLPSYGGDRQLVDSTYHVYPTSGKNNYMKRCTQAYKKSHYLLLDIQPGRLGNVLFQVYGLLAYSQTFCYTAIIKPDDYRYMTFMDPFLDVRNVVIMNVSEISFQSLILKHALFKSAKQLLVSGQYNLTFQGRCVGVYCLKGQEQFVRSSISFKKHVDQEVAEYLQTYFGNRSTVTIHVRRTDRIGYSPDVYLYSNLEWYESYIEKALDYLKSRHTRLSFIFVSDDLIWCQEHFHGDDVHFSPFNSTGSDLALLARSDHVILTIGTFGWHGAWLGEHTTVIYSRTYAMRRFTRLEFFLPSWIAVQ